MGRQVFDQFPFGFRLAGAGFIIGIGITVSTYLPEYGWALWVSLVPALLLLLVEDILVIDLDCKTWVYRRGMWPFMLRDSGGAAAFFGIEMSISQWEDTRRAERYVSTYTASLLWVNDSHQPKVVYAGRSFNAAATPAAELAFTLGIPMLLGNDMQTYDQQLSEVRAEVSREAAQAHIEPPPAAKPYDPIDDEGPIPLS